ncbi:hypothetical protein NIES39_Q02560 [Arthrospira platensis NIES-39]|nr:hypothetical protein NIES39_Q02560 [Arthrospira platensis NIES-39]
MLESIAARLTAVVVLPTPPFPLAIAKIVGILSESDNLLRKHNTKGGLVANKMRSPPRTRKPQDRENKPLFWGYGLSGLTFNHAAT